MSNSQGMHSPVEQFEIKPLVELTLGGYDVSFTNSSLFMLLALGVSSLFLVAAMRRRAMVPGRMQSLAEMMYEFVAEMVRSNVGNEGRPYFPFIFTLFVFLLFGNMLGLIPYSYTFTSQIIVTFAMAAFVFVGVTLIALLKHGLHFFSFFVPAGAPKVLIPFLIVIEVISYFVRPVSLSVRLFANMLAGHTMLKVFAGLAVMISGAGGLAMAGSLLPFAALIGLTGLEVLVAAWQADVCTILPCMYLNDALHLH
jgi:F-type H+-transporting ATPase subunit a